MPTWSLGKIISRKGPVTFVVLVDSVPYRRHADQIIAAGPDVSVPKNEGKEMDMFMEHSKPKSPVRRGSPIIPPVQPPPGSPAAAAAVPLVFDDTDDDDEFEEAQAGLSPQRRPDPEPEEVRTPFEQREKRVRRQVVHYQAGSSK